MKIEELIGNTPLIKLKATDLALCNYNFFAKLEGFNPFGSVKDRSAFYIISKLIKLGLINKQSTIIESSSGNFGIALSAMCKQYNIPFICVVDPCVSPTNERIMRYMSAQVVKVNMPDETGGYLLSRIKKVKELCATIKNSYWINQYANKYNAEAHYYGLGSELTKQLDIIDYLFIPVSSGGTITGVSRRVRQANPQVKIIAVDVVGSVIFGNKPRKRYISGMGSSMQPRLLKDAKIDWVIWIDELETIQGCLELLDSHSIFAGGSSGTTYKALKQFILFISLLKKYHGLINLLNEQKFDLEELPMNDKKNIERLIHISQTMENWQDRGENWQELMANKEYINRYWESKKQNSLYYLKKYWKSIEADFKDNNGRKKNVVFLCPDRGDRYMHNIYNPQWVNNFKIINQKNTVVVKDVVLN